MSSKRINIAKRKIVSLIFALFFCYSFLYSINDKYTISALNNPAPGSINITGGHGVWGSFALINNYGKPLYNANPLYPLEIQKFMPNGYWIVNTNVKYKLHIYDQTPTLVDSIVLPSTYRIDTHDFLLLKNGHYLLALTRDSTMDLSKLVDGGFVDANVLGLKLIEIDNSGTIYWNWDCFNHLNIMDVTSDIDLAQPSIDFTHFNSFAEDENGDIVVSLRNLDEIIKISKQTGNILWRLGGSASKHNQFTFTNDDVNGFTGFSHQHSVVLTPAGNILTYDNGSLKEPQYSRAVEYRINTSNMTATKVWEYRKIPDIYMGSQGSVQRLKNGNTLINWGIDYITEVKPDGTIALEVNLPGDFTYRAMKLNIKMDDVTKRITGTGEYSFKEQNKDTKVILNLTSINGIGPIYITRYDYPPEKLSFEQNDFTNFIPQRWVINKDSISSFSGLIKIKSDSIIGTVNPLKISILQRDKETTGKFRTLQTTYNPSSKELIANFSAGGELMLVSHDILAPVLASPIENEKNLAITDTVFWRKLYGAGGYKIQISKTNNFASLISNSFTTDTFFVYRNFDNDLKYYWRVCGTNTKDTSNWSEIRSFSTKLPSPRLLNPENNSFGFGLLDTLKWSNIGNNISYRVQISLDSNLESKTFYDKNHSKTILKVNLNSYITEYHWRVKALREDDSSDWSDYFVFTTQMEVPSLLFPKNDTLNIANNPTLKWNKVSGAKFYSIEFSEDSLFTTKVIFYDIIEDTLKILNLQYDKSYYWRVRAIREKDSTKYSNFSSFKTLCKPLTLQYPPVDTTNLNDSIYFSWENIQGATKYELQISTNNSFEVLDYSFDNLIAPNVKIYSFKSDTKYFWRVRYFKETKISDWSLIRNFLSGKGSHLLSPELLSPSNFSNSSLINGVLTWQRVLNADFYKIQLSEDSKFKLKIIDTIVRETSFYYKSLENLKKYYWRVKAFNNNDSSAWSWKWEFQTIEQGKLPVIRLLKPDYDALELSINIDFEWSKVDNVYEYQLQLSDVNDFGNIIENIISPLNTVNLKGLKSQQNYFWRVRYYTSGGDTSDWSIDWEFTTISNNNIEIPQIKSIESIDYKVPIKTQLYWSKVDNASSYLFSLSKTSDFYPRVMRVQWHKDTFINTQELEYNTLYYWRAASQNDNDISPWSLIKKFVTVMEPVTEITPKNEEVDVTPTGIISWEEIDDVCKYQLIISIDPDFENVIIDSVIFDTDFKYLLAENKYYYWKIKAFNEKNESDWSKVFSFKTKLLSNVKDNLDQIFFYPNPVTDDLYILSNDLEIKQITILNNLGKVVENLEWNNNDSNLNAKKINVGFLSSGIYFVVLNNNDFFNTKKIIIIK